MRVQLQLVMCSDDGHEETVPASGPVTNLAARLGGRPHLARLDVHFIPTLPIFVPSRHSRESGNPGDKGHGDWMPAYAGMTFSWRRTYETGI
jgi:hypothetical protein